jgi:hypothetical protein
MIAGIRNYIRVLRKQCHLMYAQKIFFHALLVLINRCTSILQWMWLKCTDVVGERKLHPARRLSLYSQILHLAKNVTNFAEAIFLVVCDPTVNEL